MIGHHQLVDPTQDRLRAIFFSFNPFNLLAYAINIDTKKSDSVRWFDQISCEKKNNLKMFAVDIFVVSRCVDVADHLPECCGR